MIKILFLDVTVLNDDSIFDCFYNEMSCYRKKKIEQYIKREDKNLSLGVGILTDIFLKGVGLCEKNMEYYENESGKPYFKNNNDIFFNLSHSGKWAMGAFSDSEVGCDIEKNCEPKEDISKFVLSEGEDKKDLIKIWTIKESYLKFKGYGLSKPMNGFSAKSLDNACELDFIDGYCTAVCSVERDFHDCHIIKLSGFTGEFKAL